MQIKKNKEYLERLQMEVKVINCTPLKIAAHAIRRCWDSHVHSDDGGPKDLDLIDRIGNKAKHTSVKNHINFTFDIKGITTKTLLALTRHDVGTEFSVQSTRYTTHKSVTNGSAGYTESKNELVNGYLDLLNMMINDCVEKKVANDEISLLLPQAWKYNLVATMSLGAVQHFLKLRLKKDAHWDIRELAHKIYEAMPTEYLYLFEDTIKQVDTVTITLEEYNKLMQKEPTK